MRSLPSRRRKTPPPRVAPRPPRDRGPGAAPQRAPAAHLRPVAAGAAAGAIARRSVPAEALPAARKPPRGGPGRAPEPAGGGGGRESGGNAAAPSAGAAPRLIGAN